MTVTLVCEWCDEDFEVYPCREDTARFCSRECNDAGGRVDQVCVVCGADYQSYKYNEDRSKCCSEECRREYTGDVLSGHGEAFIQIECDSCGETFGRYRSKAKQNEQNFCSDDCRGTWISNTNTGEDHPNWVGGYDDYYGPSWPGQRKKALERDDYECVVCGKDEDDLGREPDVHHVKAFRTYDSPRVANRLGNLVSLCNTHHTLVERETINIQDHL